MGDSKGEIQRCKREWEFGHLCGESKRWESKKKAVWLKIGCYDSPA